MTDRLGGIEACVFDAYGTLFDFNSAVAKHRDVIGPQADRLSEMWRAKQINYTWLRTLGGTYVPFWQVTGEALDHCLEACGIATPGLRDRLMDAYLNLDPFRRCAPRWKRCDVTACARRSCQTAIPECS